MKLIIALLLSVALTAQAGVPVEVQNIINPYYNTIQQKRCNFDAEGKDPLRDCFVFNSETDYYVIVGIGQPDGTLYPQEVRRVNILNPQDQEILWIEPTL